ncbi:MAG TPA: reverse transcriptase domain-containing protein, partial [Nitrospira sp.]|nr:reverse transcriptase domain-containing protein [Nitrospira sp.]
NIKFATENLTKFDYNVKDFEDWYSGFTASADAWALSGSERYLALLRVLAQEILTRVMRECREAKSLPRNSEDMTEEWLVGELRKRFSFNDTAHKRLQAFLARRKNKDETLEGYLIEKRELYLKYVELMKRDEHALTEDGQMFLEAAIKGLPKELHATIKLRHPKEGRKFVELVKSARDLQGSEIASQQQEKPQPQARKPQTGTNEPRRCYNCGEIGHLRPQCPKNKEVRRSERFKAKESGGADKKPIAQVDPDDGLDTPIRVSVEMGVNSSGRVPVVAYVDTGASSTVISAVLAERLCARKDWEESKIGAKLADGRATEMLGWLRLVVNFPNGGVASVRAMVLEKLVNGEQCLLGRDALKQVKAQVDWDNGALVLPVVDCDEVVASTEMVDVDVPKEVVEIPVQITKVLEKFKDVFDAPIKECGVVTKHYVTLTTEEPVVDGLRRTSPKQDEIIEASLKDMLDQGVIEKSTSEYASPVVLARKKDSSWRFCVDYRKLNAITRKDPYPLPRIDEILGSLGAARVMSKMDLQSGFWQIPLANKDRHKTAFITKQGKYQFKRMPFGLTGAPTTFQRVMNECLEGIIGEFAFVYLDDIIVYSKTMEEHGKHLAEVLSRLRDKGFQVKRKKCIFAVSELPFLGHVVGNGKLGLDMEKVAAVKKLAPPRNGKELQRFLGSVGYFRRFIESYARLAKPLTDLTKKDEPYAWGKEQQSAYEELLGRLTSPPILRLPDPTKSFVVRTDCSDYASGGVLLQEHLGELLPVAYVSKKLTKAERNYTTTEKEALAVVRAVKEWWFYLHGNKFVVETDHSALRSVLKARETSGRVARWVMALQELEFEVQHRPGKMMELPDMLSRQEQILAIDADLELGEAQRQDATLGPIMRALENGDEPKDPDALKLYRQVATYLVIDDGKLFYFRGKKDKSKRLVVPNSLRRDVLLEHHDSLVGAHFGIEKTYANIQERYWWPNQYAETKHYVETCEACARAKKPKVSNEGKWEATVVGDRWQRVSADFLGPVDKTERGNRYLLVFTDYFTRYVVAVPTVDCTAETVAREFVDKIVTKFGAPRELFTDNGPAFASEVVNAICKMAGTHKLFTTAYRPQANGMVERWNGTVAQSLRACMDGDKSSWDWKVPFITFAYNNSKHAATKMAPFELLFGRLARLPLDVVLGARAPEERAVAEFTNELLIDLQEGFRVAREASDEMKRAQERRATFSGGKAPAYKQGEKVWLDRRDADSTKLDPKFDGPYVVGDVHGRNYVTISKPGGAREKVHVERLKPYKGREVGEVELEEEEPGNDQEVEVDPDPMMLPNDLVGKRIITWWPAEGKWFKGVVSGREKRRHVVKYDDGEVRLERLLGYGKTGVKWKLLERRRSDDRP